MLAVGIKTFYRDEPLLALVYSIETYLPEARMYIADDSGEISDVKKELYARLERAGHVIIYPPYNTGIPVGRNMIAKRVTEPYLLYCDDDFLIDTRLNHEKIIKLLSENKDVGLVCGLLVGREGYEYHYEWDIEIGDRVLNKVTPKNQFTTVSELPVQQVDLGLNFFICRTEIFKDVLWDEELIVSTEHLDFFLQIMQTKWKVLYTREMVGVHNVQPHDETYFKFRYRKFHWLHFAEKWNVEWAQENNGEKINYITEAHKWAANQN
jgi:GT2 family glycosyltransferase